MITDTSVYKNSKDISQLYELAYPQIPSVQDIMMADNINIIPDKTTLLSLQHPSLIENFSLRKANKYAENIADTYNIKMPNCRNTIKMYCKDSIVNSVIKKFKIRSDIGIKKYGTTLDRDDLTLIEWLNHAQEEHMDAILYLEKARNIENERNNNNENKTSHYLAKLTREEREKNHFIIMTVFVIIPTFVILGAKCFLYNFRK